jgi:hypothetical protein
VEKPDSIEAKWTRFDEKSEDGWYLQFLIRNSCFSYDQKEDWLWEIQEEGITVEYAWELYQRMGINQAQPNVEYLPIKARDIREAILLRIARDELKNN